MQYTNTDVSDALGQSVKFLEAMRVGKLPDNNIVWRHDSLVQEADLAHNFPDLTGGWMEGGSAGMFTPCTAMDALFSPGPSSP